MVRTSGRILKSEHVELEGQYHLDAARAEFSRTGPAKGAAATPIRVCILENHPEYAVIEVTCSCGTRMALRCEYAGAQTPANPQMQIGASAAPGQEK